MFKRIFLIIIICLIGAGVCNWYLRQHSIEKSEVQGKIESQKIFDTHLQMYVNRAAAEKFTNEAAEILASDASEAQKRWKLNLAYFRYWISETVKSKWESLKQ